MLIKIILDLKKKMKNFLVLKYHFSDIIGDANACYLSNSHNGRSQIGYLFTCCSTTLSWWKRPCQQHHQNHAIFSIAWDKSWIYLVKVYNPTCAINLWSILEKNGINNHISLVHERIYVAVMLTLWPLFKIRGIYYRGKRGYLSASVHTWGIFNNYCLGSRI